MADEIVEGLKKFSLVGKELDGPELVNDDFQIGVLERKKSLVERIFMEKMVNYTSIKNFVLQVWNYPKNLQVVELETNMFQFLFNSDTEMEKVIRRGPWIIDNQVPVLESWEDN
ncbi:hypothetical protein ACH5RR_012811 [Cinchona calisaya]|uniref:DUF4283 domain-containing protein n=1 Tax=Cinchona calisaya TaxID=153742 RepID=A0ABD3A8N6_9GENT